MKYLIFTNDYTNVFIPLEQYKGITFTEVPREKGLPKDTSLVEIIYDFFERKKTSFYVNGKCMNDFMNFLASETGIFSFFKYPHLDDED